jgi:hypothetical protein
MLSRSIPTRRFGRSALFAAVAALAFGCAPRPEEAKPSWPEGTVMVLDGEPITAAEVDQHIDSLTTIDASFTKPHRRRLVLTSVIFLRAYARAHPDRPREEARAEAEEWRSKLLADALALPLAPPVSGNWDRLGIEYWFPLRELEPGEWSEVVELCGRFAVIQLVSRDHAPRGGQEWFEARFVEFPYVDRPELLPNRVRDATLEIVDPAWQEIVPGYWKYEMRKDQR